MVPMNIFVPLRLECTIEVILFHNLEQYLQNTIYLSVKYYYHINKLLILYITILFCFFSKCIQTKLNYNSLLEVA